MSPTHLNMKQIVNNIHYSKTDFHIDFLSKVYLIHNTVCLATDAPFQGINK